MKRQRSGQLLALLLVILVLVSLALYAFHFVAISEYAQVSKIIQNYQVKLIADAANDELALQQERADRPAWVDQVIEQIDRRPVGPAAAGAPDGTPTTGGPGAPNGPAAPQGPAVTREIVVDNGGDLPGTRAVGQGAGIPPGQLGVKTTIGPLRLAPADYDAKSIYAEPTFGDVQKDIVAWHLRGPIKVETTADGPGGKVVQVQQGTLAVTDATPIASEFALFSYMSPCTEDDADVEDLAINDLQRGGRFTVHARQVGRVLVRGPWLVLTEDGAKVNKPFQADKEEGAENPAPTFNYFERKWKNWAGIPGPRALLPPPLDLRGPIKAVTDALHRLWDKIPTLGENEIIRPERDHSPELTIGPISIPKPPVPLCIPPFPVPFVDRICVPDEIGPWTLPPLSIVVGLATGGDPVAHPGVWWSLLPDDEPARFGSALYFHGVLKPGQQTFSILGRTDDPPVDAGGESRQDVFRGVTFEADAANPNYQPLNAGGNNPSAEIQLPANVNDNHVIMPEPVPRETGGELPDVGIVSLYGIAVFDAQTLIDQGVLDLVGELIGKVVPLVGLVTTAVKFIGKWTGLRPDFYLIARQWKVRGYELPADKVQHLTVEEVAQVTDNALPENFKPSKFDPIGVLAPYGLYHYEHSIHSRERIKNGLVMLGTNIVLGKIVTFGVNKLAKFVGWLFKKGTQSRAGTYLKELADEGGTFLADHAILRGLITYSRKFSEKLFATLVRVKLSKATVQDLLRDQLKDLSKDEIKTKVKDEKGFLPRPVKAVLGSFGPEGVDHPFGHRINGVFTASKDLKNRARKLPHGMFPPKYSSWASLATRTYPDFDAYLKAEKVGDVLPLRGVVLLRKLDYQGEPIKYRGLGLVVVISETADAKPKLDARVEPEARDGKHWMQLIHLVTPELFIKKDRPVLALGELFTGTVFSETGVKPAGRGTVILGNLVCGHINKSAIDPGLKGPEEGVTVRYAYEVLGDLMKPERKPMWSFEVLGAPIAPPAEL